MWNELRNEAGAKSKGLVLPMASESRNSLNQQLGAALCSPCLNGFRPSPTGPNLQSQTSRAVLIPHLQKKAPLVRPVLGEGPFDDVTTRADCISHDKAQQKTIAAYLILLCLWQLRGCS